MKRIFLLFGMLITAVIVYSQESSVVKAPNQNLLDHSIFFIGDLGEANNVKANLSMLQLQMNEVGKKGTLVFLGNTISKEYAKEEIEDINLGDQNLLELLDIAKGFEGEFVFMPGEKEWNQGHKHGWEAILNLETYIEDYIGKGDVFLPSGGCPGPVEIELTDDVVLLVIDSQWWLHAADKPEAECGLENSSDFLIMINDALKRNKNKKIVFAAHHPMYSAGKHGGNFPFPGPVALYRKLFGTPQDFAYPFYKQMRYMGRKLNESYDNIISVSAHDNSLQFTEKDQSFYVVSGSGSKSDYVSKKKMDFAVSEIGFSKLNFYSNNEVWIELWSVGENGNEAPKAIFRQKLYTKKILSKEDLAHKYKNIDFSDSTITIAASEMYETDSKSKRKLLGNNYRKEWATPITVPVFDIGTEKGGLKILKRGGGQQTRSLRLEAKNGKQYVLRSVEKYTEKAIPPGLRGTFAAEIVQDGISNSYPYAAIAVPKLANAAGVYHTNPKIVYVPDDPRLGIYQEDFKNELYLYEERPKGDMSDEPSFGNANDVWGTDKLIERRLKDAEVQIDETAVLRARLFDVFLNDWDRHDDQWRWAIFNKDDKKIARPIPRDRDQVFFYSDGSLTYLMRRKWAMPKFQVFDSIVENVVGLGFNARYFDRNFLQSKTKSDWLKMAEELKLSITDEIIETAIKDLPQEVYKISGKELESKLIARRDQLPKLASDFYDFLAKSVDVVGTNENEDFDAKWDEDGNLKVEVRRLSKKGKKKEKLFERKFLKSETEEVRIYGLSGKDKFDIKGKNINGVKLKIVGGKGKDKYDLENTKRQNIAIYDKSKTKVKGDGAFKNKLSKNPNVNVYNRKSYKYDIVSPAANLNYVSDDGLILGAGVNIKKQNFRKEPYGSMHKFLVNYAFMYPSIEFKYSGEMIDVFKGLDLLTNINYNTPNFQGYYYGLGNETENPESDDNKYNRIRMGNTEIQLQLRKQIGAKQSISFGPFFQQLELKATADRFVTDFTNPDNDLNPLTDFDTRKYVGVSANYILDTRDSKVVPSRGIYWSNSWKFYRGLEKNDHNFQKMETDLRFYASLGRPQRSIIALRVGVAHNTSGYSFYQANKLGLGSNLRGYRRDRFAGDDIVYQNTDYRFRLAKFRSYFFGGEMGLLAFNDFGRVWLDGEDSDKWHHGYGGGFWISPFKLMVITANYGMSEEENIFSLEFKYMF
ncbi:BamA/TamA family outer membrane protein [Marinifilum sp. N1E240]|uniref:BamA/TamA family outer membrane protein n=1 Tax=Marinifilum sp. N1E240 TaxID=2608082 RepID=UPI00128D60F7|nr:BamA/TamA family outer membrane protein [Marinifilum sp. N1E240]MPQ46544.1 BamA/TamA family outer membrane protein [Marinifilum sp. N1E240]